jgi:hypothetical protein
MWAFCTTEGACGGEVQLGELLLRMYEVARILLSLPYKDIRFEYFIHK